MAESKHMTWVDGFGTDAETDPKTENSKIGDDAPAANDADGWQQYRQWISKAPTPRGRRVGIDPALYTWKGYRNWSEQVKRDWDADMGEDEE